MFLKVSLMRVTVRFGQKGMLACIYIGPFEVKSQINNVAYRMTLPSFWEFTTFFMYQC